MSTLPFEPYQNKMARAMARAVAKRGDMVAELLAQGAKKSIEKVGVMGAYAQFEASNVFSKSMLKRVVAPAIRESVKLGASTSRSKSARRIVMNRVDVTDAIEKQVAYFVNNYVRRIVVGRVKKAMEKVKPSEYSRVVKEVTHKLMKDSEHYWKTVANNAANRAYHYGLLKSADLQDHKWAVYKAVLDERTTKMCRRINGKRVNIEKALIKMESMAHLTGAEIEKTYIPFEYIRSSGTNVTLLKKLGLTVPPLHPHCRTTLIVV